MEITVPLSGEMNRRNAKFLVIGARFDPEGIAALLPPRTFPVPILSSGHKESPVKHAGGRPQKDWWDDLWAEIARQIRDGDLKPRLQAEIELAMMTWIESKGFSASESTVRIRAAKLAKALRLKAEN